MKRSKLRSEAVNTKTMNRRDFLQSGLMAGALAAAGRLPLLAADRGVGSGIDASTGPYAVKPIRDHLSRFSPARTELRGLQKYTLIYDIVHWNWVRGQRGTFANSVIGQVVIKRRVENSRVIYDVSQQTKIGGVNNFVEANIICSADDFGSLRRWQLHSYELSLKGQADPISELNEKGACQGGNIRVKSGNYSYEFNTRNPVVTQWTVLDLLIREADSRLRAEFDLLQDLSLFKPNQSLVYDGETRVRLKDGQTATLQAYSQTGQGILPIHYLIDAQGHPQLVTSSILSWALSG